MTAGDIYRVAGTGVPRYSGDGGPARSAGMWNPAAVAVDSARNLLIADQEDSRIRVVAATTGTLYGRAMKAADIYTVAGDGTFGFAGDGGPATKAELAFPAGVVPDHAGNRVIADSGNNRVRVAAARTGTLYGVPMTAGDIYTVGGNGRPGFAGDGGPATKAELDGPVGVGITGSGALVVADVNDGRVREISR